MFWSSEKEPKEELHKMEQHCWKSHWKREQHYHYHHHHHHYHHQGSPPGGLWAKYWEKKNCHTKEGPAEAAAEQRRGYCFFRNSKPAEVPSAKEANIKAETPETKA